MLYAIGDNLIAARLSGARGWQVLVVLYVISAVMAAIAGFLLSGGTNGQRDPCRFAALPSVAAAVIGGTSIFGGRGGYGGTIVGALILAVISALLTALGQPEAVRRDPLRNDRRRRRGLHAGHRRDLMDAGAGPRQPEPRSGRRGDEPEVGDRRARAAGGLLDHHRAGSGRDADRGRARSGAGRLAGPAGGRGRRCRRGGAGHPLVSPSQGRDGTGGDPVPAERRRVMGGGRSPERWPAHSACRRR